MAKARLLTFGDSFTYGDELMGSFDDPPTHDHLTFTHLLADQLGVKYKNYGVNGASNQKIFRTFLDRIRVHQPEYIVITWSSWGRLEVCEPFELPGDAAVRIDRQTDMSQIIPAHRSGQFIFESLNTEYPERKQAIIDWYDKVYTMETAIVHHLDYMMHVQWLCDKLNIRVIQGIIHPGMWGNILTTLRKPDFEDYKKHVQLRLSKLRPECKVGLGEYKTMYQIAQEKYHIYPGGHPDERAHKDYADMLFDIFEERYKCW